MALEAAMKRVAKQQSRMHRQIDFWNGCMKGKQEDVALEGPIDVWSASDDDNTPVYCHTGSQTATPDLAVPPSWQASSSIPASQPRPSLSQPSHDNEPTNGGLNVLNIDGELLKLFEQTQTSAQTGSAGTQGDTATQDAATQHAAQQDTVLEDAASHDFDFVKRSPLGQRFNRFLERCKEEKERDNQKTRKEKMQ